MKILTIFLRILSIFFLTAFAMNAHAIKMKSGTYRIVCANQDGGAVVLGSSVGQESPYYYSFDAEGDDVLWDFKAQSDSSYTICSHVDGSYVTYTGTYGGVYRYIEPTDSDEGNVSHWNITLLSDGGVAIVNVAQPDHHWHIRNNYIVGSYAGDTGATAANSQFLLYDLNGDVVDGENALPSYLKNLETLRFDSIPALYDRTGNRFFVTISEEHRGVSYFKPVITYDIPDSLTVKIDGHKITNGGSLRMTDFDSGTEFPLQLYFGEDVVQDSKLVFTYLPIVTLTGKNFSASERPGTFRITSVDRDSTYQMITHWRGNTSVNYPKKNYAVKLVDKNGNGIDRKVLGMRDDDHWILDAMQIDVARMRNRVSTDLWNDFHCDPYYIEEAPKARSGTRGKFVEMILNGNYNGVYCLTEKMDRKQFRIEKTTEQTDSTDYTIHGLYYKGTEWSYSSYMGYDSSEGGYTGVLPPEAVDTNYGWDGWEIKYPDVEDGEKGTWQPLRDAIAMVCTAGDRDFRQNVVTLFDLPVLRDYWLLIELSMAFDNRGKNMLMTIYDMQKSLMLTPGVWDLDGTWGRVWNGSVGWSIPTDDYNTDNSHNQLYSRLVELNVNLWNKNMAARYCELRQSGVFSADSIAKRFRTYEELFADSGVEIREPAMWANTQNVTPEWTEEIPYIEDWISQRLETMDAKYGYDPTVVGIAEERIDDDFVSSSRSKVYDLQGRDATGSSQHGVFIWHGKKVIR